MKQHRYRLTLGPIGLCVGMSALYVLSPGGLKGAIEGAYVSISMNSSVRPIVGKLRTYNGELGAIGLCIEQGADGGQLRPMFDASDVALQERMDDIFAELEAAGGFSDMEWRWLDRRGRGDVTAVLGGTKATPETCRELENVLTRWAAAHESSGDKR